MDQKSAALPSMGMNLLLQWVTKQGAWSTEQRPPHAWQVAREAAGGLAAAQQQERPSTAPPAGQRAASADKALKEAAAHLTSALSASSPAFVPMAQQQAVAAVAAAQQLPMPAALPATPTRRPLPNQASFLGLGGFSFSTMGSAMAAAGQLPGSVQPLQQHSPRLQQPPQGASPGSLSPFPGMSVHRRAPAPALRAIGQVSTALCRVVSGLQSPYPVRMPLTCIAGTAHRLYTATWLGWYRSSHFWENTCLKCALEEHLFDQQHDDSALRRWEGTRTTTWGCPTPTAARLAWCARRSRSRARTPASTASGAPPTAAEARRCP